MSAIADRLSAALSDRYRLERELGQGGMATAYLAEDLKHKRRVALKVLKPELAAVLGAERFVQEITTTAALQHPHILPLFDSGTADGFLYYVMPYIQGETLRSKLARETQLGVEEAVKITVEVADALDYAHSQGVVHRDIKPENILLHNGRPMVADFGIALALSAAAGGRMTETGLSLGTPHYMSPEQATAEKEITARSDIYSLGSVLYEMLTGEPPHMGNSAQQIIMKIITEDAAPVTRLRKSVPPNVAAAVARAVERLPADRFATAAEFAAALANPGFVGAPGTVARSGASGAGGTWSRLRWPVATLLVATAGIWGSVRERPGPPEPTMVFSMVPSAGATVETDNGRAMDISRNGRVIVFLGRAADSSRGQRILFLRRVGDLETRPIPGTEGARYPFLSPDGTWAGFIRRDSIKRVLVAGGPIETIAVARGRVNYAYWGASDTVVYSENAGFNLIPAMGGTPVPISVPEPINFLRPELLPGGKALIGTRRSLDSDRFDLIAMDRETGEVRLLLEDGTHPHYLSSGHLVFGRVNAGVFVIPFDPDQLAVTGPPVVVIENAMVLGGGAVQLAVADNGTAIYLTGTDERDGELLLVDQHGSPEVRGPRGNYQSLRLSPDGERVVLSRVDGGSSIYVADLATGVMSRRTFGANARFPIWSRSGRWITFAAGRSGSNPAGPYRMPAEGSGAPVLLVADSTLIPWSWGPDDGTVAAMRAAGPNRTTIEILTLAGGSVVAKPYPVGEGGDLQPEISPNGRWIAYVSLVDGLRRVMVGSFPDAGARFEISAGDATNPRWSRDGRTLYYLNVEDGSVSAATLTLGSAVTVVGRQSFPALQSIARPGFDVHPSGTQFVAIRDIGISRPSMIVALNWFSVLRGRLGGSQ